MEPLKRKIGYDRKAGISEVPPAVKSEDKEVPATAIYLVPFQQLPPEPHQTKTRSEKIIEWFGSHELISINGVCQLAQVDTSNFNKLLKAAKVIPDKILDKIEPIIKEYGYKN